MALNGDLSLATAKDRGSPGRRTRIRADSRASLNQVVGASRMRASSVMSHFGKKGPHAQRATAPDRAADAIRPARTSLSRQLNLDLRSGGEAQPGDGTALAGPQEPDGGAFEADLAWPRRHNSVYGQAIRRDGGLALPMNPYRRGPGSLRLAGVQQVDLHQPRLGLAQGGADRSLWSPPRRHGAQRGPGPVEAVAGYRQAIPQHAGELGGAVAGPAADDLGHGHRIAARRAYRDAFRPGEERAFGEETDEPILGVEGRDIAIGGERRAERTAEAGRILHPGARRNAVEQDDLLFALVQRRQRVKLEDIAVRLLDQFAKRPAMPHPARQSGDRQRKGRSRFPQRRKE